jgi:glycosyltransferase involved in cell wall biosynthesis
MGKHLAPIQHQQILEGKHLEIRFDGTTPPLSYPSVSLCMIVKNEEENLAACLDSISDFASEIIVTDTGSTDRTIEIARLHGAKVKHFAWIDDFAAARNESIKEAIGEWIFWMDADDRIAPQELDKLKQAVASGTADAYMTRVSSKEQESQTMTEHLRLFRNHQELAFERPLHETVLPGAIRQGLTIARTNIVIEHVGYEIDTEALKSKARRNLKIIQNCLAKDPEDLHWQYHLGVCYAILGDYQQAIEAYKTVVADPPESLNWDIDVYQAHISLISAYLKSGCISDAEEALRRALALFPRRHLAGMAGMFYLMKDEPITAIRFLEKASTFSQESDWLGHSWPPGQIEAELGHAYLLTGQYDLARATYKARVMAPTLKKYEIEDQSLAEAQNLFSEDDYDRVVQLLASNAVGNPTVLR